jgi:hypothetical protein
MLRAREAAAARTTASPKVIIGKLKTIPAPLIRHSQVENEAPSTALIDSDDTSLCMSYLIMVVPPRSRHDVSGTKHDCNLIN